MEIYEIRRGIVRRRKRRQTLLRFVFAFFFVALLSLDLGAEASERWDAGELFIPRQTVKTVESVAIGNATTAEMIGETVIQTVYVEISPRCNAEDEVMVPTDFPSEYVCQNFDDLVMEYLAERSSTWDFGLEILLAELRIVPDMELLLNLLAEN